MKIEIEVSEKNEATAYPYWMIFDPRQMMKPDIYSLSGMITGPFFSRESAKSHLERTRYNFGPRACVFCCSGHQSREYKAAFGRAKVWERTHLNADQMDAKEIKRSRDLLRTLGAVARDGRKTTTEAR